MTATDNKFRQILDKQEQRGVHFDVRAAERYYAELCALRSCSPDKWTPQHDLIIGMLAERPKSWLRLVDKGGYIHGRVKVNGAVTGRCTHSDPNLAQVPKSCRGLFTAPSGKWMIGADASGLELRVFAHYLARYDGGAYAREVESGDIHEKNRIAADLNTRDDAKTFIYAYLFGASDETLGALKGGGADAGAKMRRLFLNRIPAVRELTNAAKAVSKNKGVIRALDGAHIPAPDARTALSRLVQSGGASVMKLTTVIWHDINPDGIEQCLHIHDEVQAYADSEEEAHSLGQSFAEAIRQAGERLNMRCGMAATYKVGKSWSDTH